MIYQLGNIEVDTSNFHLSENGNAVAVEPKVFDLIVYMIKNRERLVTRQELFDEIWSGRIVSDTSLSNHIKSARKVLGDDGHKQQVIKTIHGRGYQFIADIEELNEQQGEASLAAAPSLLTEKKQESLSLTAKRAIFSVFFFMLLMVGAGWWSTLDQKSLEIAQGGNASKSIAVLAFTDLSPEKDQEYFSDGLSEELINLLANIPNLRVISRSSAFTFKGKSLGIPEIADRLNVSHILEGSVRSSSDELRVTAKLIEARSDTILWSRTFDRKLADIFAIQGEISTAVVEALRGHLEGKLPVMKVNTTDIEAYNAYLKGRQAMSMRIKEKLYEALTDFDRAISIDPNYAPAYAAKAEVYLHLSTDNYGDLPHTQAMDLAAISVEKAFSLDSNLAETHATKGLIAFDKQQYDEALIMLNRAIEIAPNLAQAYAWRGQVKRARGNRIEEAITDFEVAYRLDPLSSPALHHLYYLYLLENMDEKGYKFLEKLREKYGDRKDRAIVRKLARYEADWELYKSEFANAFKIANAFQGDQDKELLAIVSHTAFALKNEEIALTYIRSPLWGFWVYYCLGDRDGVDKSLEKLERSPSSYDMEFLPFGKIMRLTMNGNEESIMEAARRSKELDESHGGILFGPVPEEANAPFIIALRLQAGDELGAERLTEQLRIYIKKYEQSGSKLELGISAVSLKVLDQDYESALDLLEQLFDSSLLLWPHFEYSILKPLHEHPRYLKLVESYRKLINRERAKLGWNPIEWTAQGFFIDTSRLFY